MFNTVVVHLIYNVYAFLLVLLYPLCDLSEIRVNASMDCQKVELISYDLIFNVMSRSLLTGSSMKICDLLGSTCPVTMLLRHAVLPH